MKLIPLTKGFFAKVDDEDFDFVSRWRWCATKNGTKVYAVRNDNKKRIYLHRAIFDAENGQLVDHKNGDSLDNRKNNLRLADKSKNGCNARKTALPKSSKYKGVYWCKTWKKWKAAIFFRGKKYCLGSFDSEIHAARVANEKYKELHGAFACLNKI